MPLEDKILSDKDRAKLDGIVQQMEANKEPEDSIKLVVEDFKSKYSKKKDQATPLPLDLSSIQNPLNVQSESAAGTSESTSIPSVLAKPTQQQTQGFEQALTQIGKPQVKPVTSITAGQTANPVLSAAGTNISAPIDQTQEVKSNGEGTLEGYDLKQALAAGSSNLGASLLRTPAFLYDLAARPFNYLKSGQFAENLQTLPNRTPEMIAEDEKNNISSQDPNNPLAGIFSTLEKGAKYYEKDIKALHEEIGKKYNGTIEDAIKKGDYTDAIKKTAMGVAESAPTTIAMAMGNAAGVSATSSIMGGGAVFGAGKKGQLDETNPNMSEADKQNIAILNGLTEGVFEQFGITKLGGIAKKALAESGEEAARRIAQQGFKDVYGPLLKQYLGVPATEMVSEAATTFAQNVIDKYGGADPDLNLMRGVIDSGIIGFHAAAGPTIVMGALHSAKTQKAVERAHQIIADRKALEEDLTAPEVSAEAKPAIVDKIKELNQQEADLHQEEKDKHNRLSPEDKGQVNELLNKSKGLVDSIADENISEASKEVLKKDLEKNDKEIQSIYDKSEENHKEAEKQAVEDKKAHDELEKSFEAELNPEKPAEKPIEKKTEKKQEKITNADQVQIGETLVNSDGRKGTVTSNEGGNVTMDMEHGGVSKVNPSSKFVDLFRETEVAAQPEIKPTEKTETKPTEKTETKPTEKTQNKPEGPQVGDKVNYQGAEHTIVDIHTLPGGRQTYHLENEAGSPIQEAGVRKYLDKSSFEVQKSSDQTTSQKPETNATEKGNVEKGNLTEHPNRDESGKTTNSERSDRNVESRKEQQEKIKPQTEQVQESAKPKNEQNGKETEKTGKTNEAEILAEKEAGKKPASKNELIDEEEQTDEQKKDHPEAISKLNDDIAVLKGFKAGDIASKKFKAILERAWKMQKDGKISKATYTRYRNIAQQVLGPKVNIDAEKAKFHIEQLKEEIKKKLLGEGYKKVLMSAPGFGPKQVADLIDLTAKLASKAVDAGFSTKEAIEKAINHVKKSPIYTRLIKEKHLDENEFTQTLNERFGEIEEEKVIEPEPETKPEKKPEAEKSKPNERKHTSRILESEFVDPEIKEGLQNEGTSYIPKKIGLAQADARKVVRFYDEAGKIDDLIDKVMTDKDMGRVEKNSMAATIFEYLNKGIAKETDEAIKTEMRKKAIKVHQFLAKNLTESAQDLIINGKINKSIANGDPDVAITLLKEQAEKNIQDKLSDKKTDKEVNETVNSINDIEKEVERRIRENLPEAVEKEVDKRLLKVISKETIDKINNALDKLTIKARGKLFSDVTGLGGITTAVWNGSLLAIKTSVKIGIIAYNGIANSKVINDAIQAGIDYIKANHTDTFDEQAYRDQTEQNLREGLRDAGIELTERKNRKKEIIETVNETVDEINNGKPDKSKPAPNQNKQRDIDKAKALLQGSIDKLNLSEFAKKKLVADVIDHLENNDGKISKADFKKLYGEELGYDFVTPEMEADIKKQFDDIHKATNLQDNLEEALDDAVAKEKAYQKDGKKMPAKERQDLIDNINTIRKEHAAQTLLAQKANDKVSDYFRGGKSLYRMLGGMLQGNLLTPLSQVVNIIAYGPTLAYRFAVGSTATVLDILQAGLAKTGWVGDKLSKNLQTDTFAETRYGLRYGLMAGLKESLFKLRTGQLAEDITMRDAGQKFNAFNSLYDFYTNWKGKDLETNITNFIEGHFGIPADLMFRLLGPADITVRKSKEFGKLGEQAKAKGFEGFELMREILNPSMEEKEKAQQASLRATYQNENIPTRLITWMDKMGAEAIVKLAGEKMGYHINGTISILKTGVLPFVKTPANIVGELITNAVPVIPLTQAIINLRQGNRNGFNTNMSKAAIGAGFGYIASQIAANALFTPGPDDEEKDKEKRAMYENIGYYKLNWSAMKRLASGDDKWAKIKDGDTWVNYNKMGLPGMALGTWANYYKDKTKEDVQDQNAINFLISGLPATLKTAIESSFLQGTNKALEAVMNPEGKRSQYFYTGYIGSLSSIAYPNTVANISKSADPFIRDKRTDEGFIQMLINDFKVKMFMGDKLPTRVTLWGEDVKSVPQGTNPYLYYLLDPLKSKDISTQAFGYKIFDFWRKTEDRDLKTKILPSVPKDELSVDGNKIALTKDEYNQFQKLVGRGRAAEAEAYVLYGDFDTDSSEKRAEKLQEIYKNAYNQAKSDLLDNNERLRNEIENLK